MVDNICSNCGKKQRWYESIKIDPASKQPICRKCHTPFNSTKSSPKKTHEIKPEPNTESSPLEIRNSDSIDELVNDVFTSFNQTRKTQKNISYPSIPILYLGDYEKYISSKPKVITVGLNPSITEFPTDSFNLKFIQAKYNETSKIFNRNDTKTYLNLLNKYFSGTPVKWVNSFTPILEGLKTSYFSNMGNNTLHTNLCSPFVTDIKWSKLRSSTQFSLGREGRRFWHRLVEILKPDIILFSVDPKYLDRVIFKKRGWNVFKSITTKVDGSPRVKPYNIMVTQSRVGSNKTYLVNGSPSYLPFGSISDEVKHQLGTDLTKIL